MNRPPRERERELEGQYAQDQFEPRAVASRRSGRPVAPATPPQSFFRRNWVSIVGITIGTLFSIVQFGPVNQRSRAPGRGGPPGRIGSSTFHWNGTIAAGHQVEVKGFNGAVRAVAGDGDQVEVTAVRSSRGRNPADVPIAIIEDAGDLTVCAAAPDNANVCAGDGGLGPQNGVEIEYTIRLPRGVNFNAETVNGGITVDGVTGDVSVETVNGALDITASGAISAETVNGGIRASVPSITDNLSFETVNGSITVRLPSDAAVDVTAETLGGGISSDFPLSITSPRPGQPREASGAIGGGGNDLSMETVNGSIQLRRLGSSEGGGTSVGNGRGSGTGAGSGSNTPPRGPRGPRPPRPPGVTVGGQN